MVIRAAFLNLNFPMTMTILAKAFAKFMGGYQRLKEGSTAWALSAMTGDPTRPGIARAYDPRRLTVKMACGPGKSWRTGIDC